MSPGNERPEINPVAAALAADYDAKLAVIEKEYRARLDTLRLELEGKIREAVAGVSTAESDFLHRFEATAKSATDRVEAAVKEQRERLESKVRSGLWAVAGALITIGLVAFAAVYQSAQTQVAKAGAEFQRELAGAYKEISAARLAAGSAVAEIQLQEKRLKSATDAAQTEVGRLRALPSQ